MTLGHSRILRQSSSSGLNSTLKVSCYYVCEIFLKQRRRTTVELKNVAWSYDKYLFSSSSFVWYIFSLSLLMHCPTRSTTQQLPNAESILTDFRDFPFHVHLLLLALSLLHICIYMEITQSNVSKLWLEFIRGEKKEEKKSDWKKKEKLASRAIEEQKTQRINIFHREIYRYYTCTACTVGFGTAVLCVWKCDQVWKSKYLLEHKEELKKFNFSLQCENFPSNFLRQLNVYWDHRLWACCTRHHRAQQIKFDFSLAHA